MSGQAVLVVPMAAVPEIAPFVPFPAAQRLVTSMSTSGRWMERALAERSTGFIQPIPCAVLVDSRGRYGLFRRVEATRRDLSRQLTLIVGGHIDQPVQGTTFNDLVAETLVRELSEEVGLTQVGVPDMLAIVTDRTTAAGARHVGIVHTVKVPVGRLKALADEEFALRSKYSGAFFDAASLARMYPQFDAWSALIFEHVVNPGFHEAAHLRRQLGLPLAVEHDGGDNSNGADPGVAKKRAVQRGTRRRKGAA